MGVEGWRDGGGGVEGWGDGGGGVEGWRGKGVEGWRRGVHGAKRKALRNLLFIFPPALFSYSFVVEAWQAPSMHLAF